MTESGRSSIPSNVHDAAGEWLARRRAGADAAVEQVFAAWLEADPRHRIAYEQVSRDWRDSAHLVDSVVGRTRRLVRAPFLMRRSTHVGAISLGLAAMLGVATLGVVRHAGPIDLVSPAEAAIYRTAAGEIRNVQLADGSTLTLDTSTLVRVLFTHDSRRLELTEGRARFRVAEDSRPLIVAVSGGEIVAHQSLFDVSVVGTSPIISAIEGEIALHKVTRDGRVSTRPLVAGEQGVMGQDPAPRPLSAAEARWVSGMVALDGTPLGSAVVAINRYNRIQVHLADPRLARLVVTGAFRTRDPRQFAQAVATMFDLVIDDSHPDRLVLQPARGKLTTAQK